MSRHVGSQLSAYVDRCLDPTALREIDRHLVACQVCRHEVDQERRLLASLRHGSTPGLSASLQASLLSLAGGHELVPGPVPMMPRVAPVPTVSPTRPALHRSPRRAAGLAGFAAGASAAAAIGLAVAGPGATASPLRPASPRPVGTSSASVPVSLTVSVAGGTGTAAGSATAAAAAATLGGSTPLASVSSARPVGLAFFTRPSSTGR